MTLCCVQRVVDKGVRDAKWIKAVEGTYMRLDIPHIMPHLMKQLEERKKGQLLHKSTHVLLCAFLHIIVTSTAEPG